MRFLVTVIFFILFQVKECIGQDEFKFNPIFSTKKTLACGLKDKEDNWFMNGTLTLSDLDSYLNKANIQVSVSKSGICNLDLSNCNVSPNGDSYCVCTGSSASGGSTVYNLEVKQIANAALNGLEIEGTVLPKNPFTGTSMSTNNPTQTLPLIYRSVAESFNDESISTEASLQESGRQTVSYCVKNLKTPYTVMIKSSGSSNQSSDNACVNLEVDAQPPGLEITVQYNEMSSCKRKGNSSINVNVRVPTDDTTKAILPSSMLLLMCLFFGVKRF